MEMIEFQQQQQHILYTQPITRPKYKKSHHDSTSQNLYCNVFEQWTNLCSPVCFDPHTFSDSHCKFNYTSVWSMSWPNQDQLWGLLSRQLGRNPSIVDTDSAVSILTTELQKPSVRKWVNGEILVHTLRTHRDWKGHYKQYAPVEFDFQLVLGWTFAFFFSDANHFSHLELVSSHWIPRKVAFCWTEQPTTSFSSSEDEAKLCPIHFTVQFPMSTCHPWQTFLMWRLMRVGMGGDQSMMMMASWLWRSTSARPRCDKNPFFVRLLKTHLVYLCFQKELENHSVLFHEVRLSKVLTFIYLYIYIYTSFLCTFYLGINWSRVSWNLNPKKPIKELCLCEPFRQKQRRSGWSLQMSSPTCWEGQRILSGRANTWDNLWMIAYLKNH